MYEQGSPILYFYNILVLVPKSIKILHYTDPLKHGSVMLLKHHSQLKSREEVEKPQTHIHNCQNLCVVLICIGSCNPIYTKEKKKKKKKSNGIQICYSKNTCISKHQWHNMINYMVTLFKHEKHHLETFSY
jgi:hypothetical protein